MPAYHKRKRALPDEDHARLKDKLLSSSLISSSTLKGTFEGSRGFALVFTERGISEVRARFPEVGPYLELALDERARDKLAGPLARWRKRSLPRPNAFYLNLLLLDPGERVGPHFDATLRDVCGDDETLPVLVSVLYLEVPEAGGELVLTEHRVPIAVLPPEERALVWFRGNLNHEVRAYEDGALRASLVLEQYHLDEEALSRMPRVKVQSRAGFGAYLNRADPGPTRV